MKHVIIGTAGHIDHGKTTLIKALTGNNTDRLKDEQKRGITIDLGFTYFDLPDGVRAGIVDVPGHEKFIKNMLAGAVGMDIVILLVAADEGMMPQSIEHLEILDLLGVKHGLIALTKIDMVEDEWIELIKEDTRERLEGSFLEGAPMVEVSGITGQGIEDLKLELTKIVDQLEDEDPEGDLPRLPVDRSFTISGHGTVVTGTLISGVFNVGDEVQIFPTDIKIRIRSLQVHGQDVDKAYKGQRVAINLANVSTEEARRGSMIAPIGSMKASRMLDVKLKTVDLPFDLANRTRLRVYIGTQEVFARMVLLEDEIASSRGEFLVQLRLEDDMVARKGDKFIVRLFSPMITVGGGEVIDANPSKKKRFNEDDLDLVKLMDSGDSTDITEAIIEEHSKDFPSINDIAKLRSKPIDMIEREAEKLEEETKVYIIKMTNRSYIIHKNYLEDLVERIEGELNHYHDKYPLRPGINKEEIRSKYLAKASKKPGELFLDLVIENSKMEEKNNYIKMEDFSIKLSARQEKIKDDILAAYDGEGLTSPDFTSLKKKYKKNEFDEVYQALIFQGYITIIEANTSLRTSDFKEAKKKIVNYIKEKGPIELAEARDLLGTSRKLALAVLENMDREKITVRTEEGRQLT